MIKKLFLLLILSVMSTPVWAMYWGCNDLTTEEMEKAKSVLKAAQEIVLLDYSNTPHIILYKDIQEKLYNADNFGMVRLFEIEKYQKICGANELFVRLKDENKYQNLGLIIGCEAPTINFVREINQDLSFMTLKDQYFAIKEKYEKCSDVSVPYDEKNIRSIDIRRNLYAQIDCYKAVAYELFDVFHPKNPQPYKDNLTKFLQSYSLVLADKYEAMDGYVTGSIIADYIAGSLFEMTKKIVQDYIYETGIAGDFIEESM